MDVEKIKTEYAKFQEKGPDFGNLMILSREGNLLWSLDPDFTTEDQTKGLMDVWLNSKPAVELNGNRYPILKWDELQFAAKNTAGKGAIIGCVCKSKNFAVVQYSGTGNLIGATVELNRWSWNIV
jgi:hypothetical protein